MTTTHTATINVPSVPHGPTGAPTIAADADYYRNAARNIRQQAGRGNAFAGSNLTETVAKLCDEVADKLTEMAGPVPAPEPLTAADFEMRWDAEHTFPFVESEDAAIMAYGHPDRDELAAQITEYDRISAGPKYADEIEPTDPDSIQQAYAVVTEGKSGDDWYIRWDQKQDAPGAFPVSVVIR